MHKLNYIQRLIGTAISFSVFGLAGVIAALSVFPYYILVSKSRDESRRRSQHFNQRWFALFIRMMRFLGVMTFEITGIDRLKPGQLIVPNHPTLIDVVIVISLLKEVDCIVKGAIRKNPFMLGPARAADYIPNTDPEQVVNACVERLNAGRSVLIFPEGTRSVPGQPLRMQRGFARIAWRAQQDLTPVVISCSPPTLTKGTPWYRIPSRKFHVRVDIQPDIPLEQLANADLPESAAVRRITNGLCDYYEEALDQQSNTFMKYQNKAI